MFLKLTHGFVTDARRAKISSAAFRLHIEGICMASRTRGLLAVKALSDSTALSELIDAGFWIETDRGYQIVKHFATARTYKECIPDALRIAVFDRDEWKCLACGSTEVLSADHVIPESKGGPTEFWNLQTLCKRCNSRKGTQEIDYRAEVSEPKPSVPTPRTTPPSPAGPCSSCGGWGDPDGCVECGAVGVGLEER